MAACNMTRLVGKHADDLVWRFGSGQQARVNEQALAASDPMGVYCIVDKVVLEPADRADRAQIWGTCALANTNDWYFQAPAKGYFYFSAPSGQEDAARAEWADLKSVAGTGQIVGFGSRYEEKGALRQTDAKPDKPEAYPLGFGMTKVAKRDYKPINELLALHNSKSAGAGEKKSKKE